MVQKTPLHPLIATLDMWVSQEPGGQERSPRQVVVTCVPCMPRPLYLTFCISCRLSGATSKDIQGDPANVTPKSANKQIKRKKY